ncbi:hypothetical protein DL771_008661 [Monosporascus sp. 5C6A]|nr:hypothetical protein DL771_008661 [Monosporascus sp. 5C6A]
MGSLVSEPEERRRILYVDAFDSFTNNIIGLLEQCLGAEVTLVHMNDAHVDRNLNDILRSFDAVVVGPGPGHPAIPNDVGFINKLWKLDDAHMLPILGICLGFQSLSFSHGAEVKKLKRPRHGVVSRVSHSGSDVFAGISDLDATQYHSLRVDLGGVQNCLSDSEHVFWEPTEKCPTLQPLAWDSGDEVNGPVLMGLRHTTKPFWGVQFHPESICTSQAGKELVANWWAQAKKWLSQRSLRAVNGWSKLSTKALKDISPTPQVNRNRAYTNGHNSHSVSHLARELRSITGADDVFLRWGRHPAASVTPTSLLEELGLSRDEVVLLDSQGHARGRFSILGLVLPGKTMKVAYRVSDRTLRYGVEQGQMSTMHVNSIEEVWPVLQEALDLHDPRNQERSSRASSPGLDLSLTGMDCYVAGHLPSESPFWGGFMGYISYEAGLETIDVDLPPSCASSVPDINFAFIHRSIVIDHAEHHVYIQSLLPRDWEWILNLGRTIDGLASRAEIAEGRKTGLQNGSKAAAELKGRAALNKTLANAQVNRPAETSYRDKVLRCQEYLASGDSYELCLTDETEITVPTTNGRAELDPWQLYKKLRQNNPAPFGAFLRLSNVVVVGSSPERFLQWTRSGRCQFRPIKGTVKKGPEMTRELAYSILGSSKERAENLMIVDLIRHDLSGVVGAENTWVSKLMVVEEYETVYQLVSVVEGQLPDSSKTEQQDAPRGIDVLKASLPPGSMTGAPKKRSCEILRGIEQRPRGVYSGVLGYLDVGGSGDFSVVIRTAVRGSGGNSISNDNGAQATNGNYANGHISGRRNGYANGHLNGHVDGHSNGQPKQSETWRVGAGGAVTIQSTDEGEFLEMEVKASSVLGALLTQKS